jgi:hypothetical protein
MVNMKMPEYEDEFEGEEGGEGSDDDDDEDW